jgi:lysophospholipase L1-like esterase
LAHASRANPAAFTYVALGDSYTSGPSVPSPLGPGTTPSAPPSCLRSSGNYPSLTARALGLELTDVSCAGATTGDLTGPQGPGIPPQLSALRPSTSVVTVGIGGNDLGFSSIVTDCAAATPWGATKVGWSCARHYDTDGTDALAPVLQRVANGVATVLDDIRARAHRAQVFVIGYPQIVPPTGSGCWPRLPFSAADTTFLRGVESALDSTLAHAAAAAGDHYVDMATPSAAHNACTSHTTRWVEPLLASRHTFPVHPSAAGMAGMASVLEGDMRSAGIA